MNMEEILLGGVPQQERQPAMGQTPAMGNPPSAPNPFAGLLNVGKMMQESPEQVQMKIKEMAMKGIRPPPFTPDTFLQYVQTNQSARNGAVADAGQGIPAQGATPMTPMPLARNGY